MINLQFTINTDLSLFFIIYFAYVRVGSNSSISADIQN